nr:MAG TPA: Rhomboid family [Caudoviricetes sp.]
MQDKTKTLSLALALLTLTFYWIPIPHSSIGIYTDAPWWGRWCYSFFHTSIIHWLLNSWCLLSLAFYMEVSIRQLIYSYIIASLFPVATLYELFDAHILTTPTMGLSGACYALIGMVTPQVARKREWFTWIAIGFAVSCMFPLINQFVHLWGFIVGLIAGYLTQCAKK